MTSDHAAVDHAADIDKHVKIYITVFVALMALTIVTVAISRLHLPVHQAVTIALIVAVIKGSLVAGFFMHLISEKKMIYGILVFTVIFLAGLMYLTIWSTDASSLIHIKHVP